MESPKTDGNAIEASAAISPSEKKSPFSKFLSDLSPIKSSRARASLCAQRLTESSFPTIPSVFSSPHLDMDRPLSFLQRDDIGGSSSNARRHFYLPSNSALEPRIQKQIRSFNPSEVVGEYQAVPTVNHGEYLAQHGEPCACFIASEVTSGKANDNTNDGAQVMSLVEISDDESMNEKLDKMLEFSSDNIWDHVQSDEFMEHRVGQGLNSQATFLGPHSVISSENGGNQAMSTEVPSHILQLNNDPLISPARKVDDHVDNDHHGVHVMENMAPQWDSQKVSNFNQLRIPCQQFADRVEELSKSQDSSKGKRKKETYTDETESCKLCNCKRSKCLKLYCECFAAGIYCEDCCACENCFNKPDYEDIVLEIRHQIELRNPLAFAPPIVKPPYDSPNITGDGNSNPSSARHKRGCKCKRSKCLKKYCECYRAKVGCSDGCHCEDCDNSFGKKSGATESVFQGAEKWKNQSHEMPNMAEVMSDSTKVGSANQFSPTWEKLTDINHLTVSTHPHSRAVPSLTSHDMRDCQNVSQAESKKGTKLHWCSSALSPKQPCPSKVSGELHSIDDFGEMMGDGLPDFLMENSNPTITVKSGSPSQKRISPPKFQSYELGLNSPPGRPTARKLVLQAAATSRFSTPTTFCNSEDHINETENDHHVSNHDQ